MFNIDRLTIRKKLLIVVVVLAIAVGTLAYSGVRGVLAYRDLAVTVRDRAAELPITAKLTQAVDNLHWTFQSMRPRIGAYNSHRILDHQTGYVDFHFRERLIEVSEILFDYERQLASSLDDPFLANRTDETQTVEKINACLRKISDRHATEGIIDITATLLQIEDLRELRELTYKLPTFLQSRMVSFREEVRSRYRTWITMTIASTLFAITLLIGLLVYARRTVIKPFKELLSGARKVASGQFDWRIEMNNHDELAELAAAINMATAEFLKIERDLNDQVRERSREVIRNEQLASVGFLAAGVAHEINNPLASIAWSAEALESRLHRILHPLLCEPPNDGETHLSKTTVDDGSQSLAPADLETLKSYLKRIQDEAFRCKGITERLLDFSRLGQAEKKQQVDMTEVIQDVVEMVKHLGQYRNRDIRFSNKEPSEACASPQEMKQVVLNLLTNALDALPTEQHDAFVELRVENDANWCRLIVEDNGCGMSEEVQEHLFEPFFTRRRDGRGTGLGLPISSRIIADHGGRIIATSKGIDQGAKFEVQIPRFPHRIEHESFTKQAA